MNQIDMISDEKYLNETIKTETVLTVHIFSLMSQKNLRLTGFYFLNYKSYVEAVMFFGKIVTN